jgi:hypothetical protein
MIKSEKNYNKQTYIYDDTEATLNRLSIRYESYIQSFGEFLYIYEQKTDGDERQFIENELEIFEEVRRYFTYLNEDSIDNFYVYEFQKQYKPYLNIINEATRHINTLDNSLERKCNYLKNRLTELTETSNNT